jgi:hypothetical protein
MNVPDVCLDSRELQYYIDTGKKHCTSILEEINSYQPMAQPGRPVELNEFYLQPKGSQAANADKFFKQDFIKEYLDKKWEAELNNRDCFLRLYELYKQDDGTYKNQLLAKLNQFKNVILRQKKTFKTLCLDFKQFNFAGFEEEW